MTKKTKKTPGKKWTEEEDDFLKFAFNEKLTLDEMEEALEGRTKIAIRGRITVMGLRRNFPPRIVDGLVRCSCCQEYKPKDNFLMLKDGTYYCYCRECKREKSRQKYLARKLEESNANMKTKIQANNNEEIKVCNKCNKSKNVEDFSWNRKGVRLLNTCRECNKEITKNNQQKRLRAKGY
jgi:hypothetical protein